jgi:hypothetical protein
LNVLEAWELSVSRESAPILWYFRTPIKWITYVILIRCEPMVDAGGQDNQVILRSRKQILVRGPNHQR